MKNWPKRFPPYEGEKPYLYLAFAEADAGRVWPVLRVLLERGCRVWYSLGPAGSAEELLHRQERSGGAALTLLYLTDAACADADTKSSLLVNQNRERPILCLDPDETDRRLAMGLRENIPHLPLYRLRGRGELESALIHAEGFSQEILGEPVKVEEGSAAGKLAAVFCALAVLLALAAFAGGRYLHAFQPEQRDEVSFSDPVIAAALREEARGGAITEELAGRVQVLHFKELPENWEELSGLPALQRIVLPQQALTGEAELPELDVEIELTGGGS